MTLSARGKLERATANSAVILGSNLSITGCSGRVIETAPAGENVAVSDPVPEASPTTTKAKSILPTLRRIALPIVTVLHLFACSGGNGGRIDPLEVEGSCAISEGEMNVCMELSNASSATLDQVQKICTDGGGAFHRAACAGREAYGSCHMSGAKGDVTMYYSGKKDPTAQSECWAREGTWSP